MSAEDRMLQIAAEMDKAMQEIIEIFKRASES